MFIGYYNLANLITLTGLSSAIGAVFLAQCGYYKLSVMALLVAGLTDMFDGRVARHANREDKKSKMFGIQIDTVSDMVSFGVTPAVMMYIFGCKTPLDIVILIFYALCGAIRLAYFNTQAILETEDLNLKTFTGIPIPTVCFVIPPLMLLSVYINTPLMIWAYRAAFVSLGILYISKIKIKKMGLKASIVMIATMAAVIAGLLLSGEIHSFN